MIARRATWIEETHLLARAEARVRRLVVRTSSWHEGLEADRESMEHVVREERVDVTTYGDSFLGVARSLHRRREELAQVLLELAPPHRVLSDFDHFERPRSRR